MDFGTVRGTQFLQPLFEFSGACTGCGETPYLKLLTQLFGERLTVANATGCSSIYGGNLPTTPWTHNAAGRGPAWSNSLFEDDAEFGLGLRLAADLHTRLARQRLTELSGQVGTDLADAILAAPRSANRNLPPSRIASAELNRRLNTLAGPAADDLRSVSDRLLRRSVWLVGGDGWAYDIGSGGLDHVLASGRNVNVLVLDTEVYSNTGGQASKSTPLAAVAKFAAAGKAVAKKDLALQAIAYGSVYVARVAMGADPQQTLTAFREAEAYDGPSLIIAYSHCIAHGIEMRDGLDQQYRAVASGHWPLVRFRPEGKGCRAKPLPTRFPATAVGAGAVRVPGVAIPDAAGRQPRRGRAAAGPCTAGRRSAMDRVRGDGHPARGRLRRGSGQGRQKGLVMTMVDLQTKYLGLTLRSPLVASASPMTRSIDRVRALADAGVGAVVLPSLFEEQLRREEVRNLLMTEPHEDSFPEAMSYFPTMPSATAQPWADHHYLDLVERTAAAVDIPVIASINGSTGGGWTHFARAMQESGAAAIELNIYLVPGDVTTSGREIEMRHLDILASVKESVTVPVAVKIGPQFSNIGEMVLRLVDAGADGVVLFNRFLQPDVDTETLRVESGFALSTQAEARCPGPGSLSFPAGCTPRWRRPPGSKTAPTSPRISWPARTS